MSNKISDEAREVAHDGPLLKQKLRSGVFREACGRCGVEPKQLLPKRLIDFRREPDSPVELDAEETRLRYMAFEETRLRLLTLTLAEETRARRARQEREEFDAKIHEDLTNTLKKELVKEKQAMDRMRTNRGKYERMLESENANIHKHRKAADKRVSIQESRHKAIAAMKQKVIKQMQEQAARNEEKIRRTNAERQRLVDDKRRDLERGMDAREQRVAKFRTEKANAMKASKKAERDRDIFRQDRRNAAKQIEAQKIDQLQGRMAEKDQHVTHLRMQKDKERKRVRTMRVLKSKAKKENAARLRKAQEFQKQQMVEKMQKSYQRMEKIREMKHAIEEQRKHLIRDETIRRDHWKSETALERAITPGPGAYNLGSTLDPKGGTMARRVPDEFDILERKAGLTPGPGQYTVNKSTLNKSYGTISQHNIKTELDWKLYHAQSIPGPGAYKPKPVSTNFSASFGTYKPKHEIDKIMDKARFTPAPGYAQKSNVPKMKKKLNALQKEFKVGVDAVLFAAKLQKGRENAHARGGRGASRGSPTNGSLGRAGRRAVGARSP